jgi:hypothetical protein
VLGCVAEWLVVLFTAGQTVLFAGSNAETLAVRDDASPGLFLLSCFFALKSPAEHENVHPRQLHMHAACVRESVSELDRYVCRHRRHLATLTSMVCQLRPAVSILCE